MTDEQILSTWNAFSHLDRQKALLGFTRAILAQQAAPSSAGADAIARQAVEEFKHAWSKVPYFADRVNKATREAITIAVTNMLSPPVRLNAAPTPPVVSLGGDALRFGASVASVPEVVRDAERYRYAVGCSMLCPKDEAEIDAAIAAKS